MKHIVYAEKPHLMGDDAADALMEYARALADAGRSDVVTLRALDEHGSLVDVTFLLTPSTPLLTRTTNSEIDGPDNAAVVEELGRLASRLMHPPETQPEEAPAPQADRWETRQ
ncbi:hypothetical protein F6J84_05450 [Microbacterium caowuchunii]|uniref:hypothetical protein n=1 Tax=Microbacterium caowuchunii TaxID=2614638 RepID=UPI001246CBA0|nr:hypothetical protein [Microbacterium caowuchunii]QEV99600.1 hypothetical protein F6J84_05450 [Microbacterium caowuchunii]